MSHLQRVQSARERKQNFDRALKALLESVAKETLRKQRRARAPPRDPLLLALPRALSGTFDKPVVPIFGSPESKGLLG